LVGALVGGDLVDTLSGDGPFTVFAPTNEAFAKLPAGTLDDLMKPENKDQLVDILTYHVVPGNNKAHDFTYFQKLTTVEGKPVEVFSEGGKVQVGPSSVSLSTVGSADNLATNGVVHIIDEVLLPPSVPSKDKTIVELAESVDSLSTLVAALVGGGLVDTLSGEGPFTVFAPTNEAFAKLPAGTLDDLMKPENKDQLVDILTYHVVPGKILAGDLSSFQAVTTVESKPLHVVSWGGQVQLGPSLTDLSKVTLADNLAVNGVVHVIDGVLLPPTGLVSV